MSVSEQQNRIEAYMVELILVVEIALKDTDFNIMEQLTRDELRLVQN